MVPGAGRRRRAGDVADGGGGDGGGGGRDVEQLWVASLQPGWGKSQYGQRWIEMFLVR